jgi:general secretion pathway protein G
MIKKRHNGFTLIELVIVLALIGILVGLGIPTFKNSMKKARETGLKENLHTLRILINQYYTDKQKYPVSLQTLVDEKYLYVIPPDPITRSAETWIEVPEELNEDDLLQGVMPGMADVKSGAEGNGLDGTPYGNW